MTLSPPPPRLLLVSLGAPLDPDAPARLLPAVAARLSGLSGLPLQAVSTQQEPGETLAALHALPGAWLAALPLDPGVWRSGGSWAEALGAWRQPCLLVIAGSRLDSGLPAAGAALLERWGVPLAGLIQWQGCWHEASRRCDGLPWLGRLGDGGAEEPLAHHLVGNSEEEPDEVEAEARLLSALRLRWSVLAAQLS